MSLALHRPHHYVPDEYEVTDQGCQADLEHGILNKERYGQGKEQSSCAENDEVN